MHRLAFDLTPAITGGTGIARYVSGLATALATLPDGPVIRSFAVGRGSWPAPGGTRRIRVPLRVVDRLWRWTDRPRVETLIGSVDTVHASGPVVPPSRAPAVGVVHDLAPLDHPGLHPKRDAEYLRRYLDRLERTAAVIAVSAATAERLRRYGVPPDKIRIIPNGRPLLPAPVAPPLTGRPYVLAVGAPTPRKGFDLLLQAMAHVDHSLSVAIVGPSGPEDDRLKALAASLGLGERMHRAGPVSDAELAGWYRDARALAAPSVDEGFGLPLIEALAAHVPVVASDLAAFREVTAGGALLVPVGDVEALARAIGEAASGGAEVMAAVERGATHSAMYTWTACATATLAVHREVLFA